VKRKQPTTTYLKDYTKPGFTINNIEIDFDLHPTRTKVVSSINIVFDTNSNDDFFLNGEDITLVSLLLDGKALAKSKYKLDKDGLHISHAALPRGTHVTLQITTQCNPQANTQLMGLYVSGGRFCTQCEAEGFRRISFFPDRPDVLTTYKIRIEADKKQYPTLLSNGNCVEQGGLPKGRHFAVWHDPFPKPCYLFALVAGQFDTVKDNFITMSGRDIDLEIFVDPGDAPRALYAMDALKRAMKWDEEAFGREYDLDRFMVVAVRDFNFGAMENKGLNIFNSSLLLADEASATDQNFEFIEAVIGHEYFHNWSGNRITCRDWFQLCLKEGFTVFRDQEFSAAQRGSALTRIKDVRTLRARQFPEDAGPLAHPVRPESYMKIDNFYTATIYEKGAELIRMLKTLLGDEMFRKGSDEYFDTLDGTAATIEQFIACFEKVADTDLSQFLNWYHQAGTPKVNITSKYDAAAKSFDVTFVQSTAPTPGQPKKHPVLMPVKTALLAANGQVICEETIVLKDTKTTHTFEKTEEKPTLSAFQGFSAPVQIEYEQSTEDTLLLMRNDPDAFNRWEAGQKLAREIIAGFTQNIQSGTLPSHTTTAHKYVRIMGELLAGAHQDQGFTSLVFTLPSDGDILRKLEGKTAHGTDPLAIRTAAKMIKKALAQHHVNTFEDIYVELSKPTKFVPDAAGSGRRALRNTCLSYVVENTHPRYLNYALNQFEHATNMTEEMTALILLVRRGGEHSRTALRRFRKKWQDNPLVIDKWHAAFSCQPGDAGLQNIIALTNTADFHKANPNRARALIGGFAASNPEQFHRIDGAGYRFFADNIQALDKRNPQVAARLLGAFESWRSYDEQRQSLIHQELSRILAQKPSENVFEIATKSLGDFA
jgi:aminopeptidase N